MDSKARLFLLLLLLPSSTLSYSDHSTSKLSGVYREEHATLLSIKSQLGNADPSGLLSTWNDSTDHCYFGPKLQCRWAGIICDPSRHTAYLDLSSLGLSGPIPPSIANLTFLETLDLHNNSFHGPIPHWLGSLPNLQRLVLYSNSLSGKIPPELGNLQLVRLELGQNKLSGEIPPPIYNISSLAGLHLGDNNLSGTLPDGFALGLPKLQYLYMYENSFEGPIPKSLSMATELVDLELCSNSFEGPISLDFSTMSQLEKLDLAGNKLVAREPIDWLFLDSLSRCRNLKYLDLRGNDLGGNIPDNFISNLSLSLEHLSFQSNKIESEIPLDIGKFINLTKLHLDGNLFVGPIPNSIGRLLKLQELFLDNNRLTGSIPPSLGNLRELNILRLQENNLTGSIPKSLGDCTKLTKLDISGNSLNGTVAREILSLSSLSIVLNLSRNSFAGSLPAEVGRLVNLQSLDVSNNQISGEIPSSLGDCVVLQNLYLQGNSFQGVIPSSFSKLKGVLVIDLSRNNLSGPIPEFLARMSWLNLLNLSSNNLEGKIPEIGIFGNTSGRVISVLGNDRLCGRISESIFRQCAAENPKSQHISTAPIVVIVVVSVIALATLAIVLLCCAKKRSRIAAKRQSSMPKLNHFDRVTYQDLYTATNGFAEENLIGKGGFGSVYRGFLCIDESNREVAIKVLNLEKHGALKSFSTECEVLRNIRHFNLVKILTACSGYDAKGFEFKALIFEFMSNGNLDKWLHAEGDGPHVHLTVAQRFNIAVDVASGLEYLHHGGQVAIVHCDLKPSNILLDVYMGAHVGDFGLAKLVLADNEAVSSSIWLKGSIGYIPPEYGMGREVSTQGDVYSYGVFLLELFTGKRPTDDEFESGTSLRDYVESAYPEGVMSVMDPSLGSQSEGDQSNATRKAMHDSVSSVIRIALSCAKDSPNDRMDMRDVAKDIRGVRDAYLSIAGGKGKETDRVDILIV